MGTFSQDIRYALRNLTKSPMFTAVALLSLALGIGANTAIFSLMNQVLLRLLPVKEPERLVLVQKQGSEWGMVRGPDALSYPMYKDLRDRTTVFDGLLAYAPFDLSMSYKGQTERITGDLVSGNFFDVLGTEAAIGRTLTSDDDGNPGGHPVAVLSYGFWTRRFARDPGIVDQAILVNGTPLTVVGVTKRGFTSAEANRAPDLFVPVAMKKQMTPTWDDLQNRRAMWLNVMGRLKPGVETTQAQAALNAQYAALVQDEVKELPAGMSENARRRFLKKTLTLAPGQKGRSELRQRFSTPLLVLMGMVGLVLLIACANVANLLVARAAARQKEIAIRLAIGASRFRIIRQLLLESVTLALAGGFLGLLVAAWTGALLLRFLPVGVTSTYVLSSSLDTRVLAFNFVLALCTGLLFGLAPALQATRPDLAPTLKNQAGSVSAAAGQVRFRKMLVIAQVALSLLLLIGAGLFARSLYNLKSLDPGFRYDRLLTFSVDPATMGYSRAGALDFHERLVDRIERTPGVRGVSYAQVPMMADDEASMTVRVEGYHSRDGENMNLVCNWTGPAFFSTVGIPVLQGRDFTAADKGGAPKVAIINESAAKYFFGHENPIGKHIGVGRDDPRLEIIGIVRDAKQNRLREETSRWAYFPVAQASDNFSLDQIAYYVRSDVDPATLSNSMRRAVQSLDPTLPVFAMRSLSAQVDDSIFLDRIVSALSAFFGLLATLLAAIGLYGVMAYTVARRTREIGIRVALGADRSMVLRIIMVEVGLLAGTGIALALPFSYPLARLVESQLFGIKAADPVVMAGATIALAFVALAAGYLPALRATRIDPMVALRYE